MTNPAERAARIDAAARAADGFPSLGDAVWRDLKHPGPDSAGFFADDRAYVHVARSDTFAPRHWAVGVVVHPDARGGPDRRELLEAARLHIAAHGGGRMVVWIFGAASEHDPELAALGFEPVRGVIEMRVALPIDEKPVWPAGVSVRTFEPGRDEADWLAVNNNAFRNHPEQGDWIAETLARRMAEPWFDPTLFFLAFDDDGLVGFNWLKVHDASDDDPALGEIFVIGVDPRAHGRGLGRALALEGLGAVSARGLTVGSLFTAIDNEPAQRLYHALGFRVHRTDRAFEAEVEPA